MCPVGAVYFGRDLRRFPQEESLQRRAAEADGHAAETGAGERQSRACLQPHAGLQAAAGSAAEPGLSQPQAGPR